MDRRIYRLSSRFRDSMESCTWHGQAQADFILIFNCQEGNIYIKLLKSNLMALQRCGME